MPVRLELTPDQAHDAPLCKALPIGLQPGQAVLADKAYDADWIREMILEQGAVDVIPPKPSRKLPKDFGQELYKLCNKIERFFCRLKSSFRRIAKRYEKTSANFLSMIRLAVVRISFHFMSPMPRIRTERQLKLAHINFGRKRRRDHSTSKTASTSTSDPKGRLDEPTAARACMPASPKTPIIRAEAPFTT